MKIGSRIQHKHDLRVLIGFRLSNSLVLYSFSNDFYTYGNGHERLLGLFWEEVT